MVRNCPYGKILPTECISVQLDISHKGNENLIPDVCSSSEERYSLEVALYFNAIIFFFFFFLNYYLKKGLVDK